MKTRKQESNPRGKENKTSDGQKLTKKLLTISLSNFWLQKYLN